MQRKYWQLLFSLLGILYAYNCCHLTLSTKQWPHYLYHIHLGYSWRFTACCTRGHCRSTGTYRPAVQNYLISYLNDFPYRHFKWTRLKTSCLPLEARKTQVVDIESGSTWVMHVDTWRLKRVYNLFITSHDTKNRCNREICRNGPVYFKVEGNLASHPHSCHMLITLLTFTSVGILKALTMLRSTAERLWHVCLIAAWVLPKFSSYLSVHARRNIHQVKIFVTQYGTS